MHSGSKFRADLNHLHHQKSGLLSGVSTFTLTISFVFYAQFFRIFRCGMDMAFCNDHTLLFTSTSPQGPISLQGAEPSTSPDSRIGATKPRERASVREISICVAVRTGPRIDTLGMDFFRSNQCQALVGGKLSRLREIFFHRQPAPGPNSVSRSCCVTWMWRAEVSTKIFIVHSSIAQAAIFLYPLGRNITFRQHRCAAFVCCSPPAFMPSYGLSSVFIVLFLTSQCNN